METEQQTNNVHTSHSTQVGNHTETAPVMKVSDWMITLLLLAIPLVNIIMLFVWAFGGGTNPNKANYSKATLLWMLIVFGIYILIFVLILGLIGATL